MFSLKRARRNTIPRLPNHVVDVQTASCVFCPYGADVQPGDRVYAFDEKTAFGRRQRERLVEVTAVKPFRSTGRLVTIDLKITGESDLLRIAVDSEIPLQTLYEHHSGNPTYIDERPPVVVYFKPCNEDDTLGAQSRLGPQRPGARQAVGARSGLVHFRRGRKY
ncbi:MAG TPA: hypothetical protein VGT99_00995 [Gammaproteobacteria bacterium]|nr:hypothetical protein [Gammaproteobacteria bacterium]